MQTLRTLKALERERLVVADPRLAEAAEAMAIAVTPEMLELIDRPGRSDRAPVRAQRRRDRDLS